MAKRKKQYRSRRSSKRSRGKLIQAIDKAMSLHNEGESEQAQRELLQLVERNPRSKPALLAITELSVEMEAWPTYAYYAEKLLPLERGNDQAETLNNVIYAFLQAFYPALAWHYANELRTKHPDFVRIEQVQSMLEILETSLQEEARNLKISAETSTEEKLSMMVGNDRVRFYMENGHPAEAIMAAEPILKKAPDLVSVLNNLSMCQFMVGEVEKAIAAANKVLAGNPDNFHALSNLVRFNFLTAQFDQAQEYASRLEHISSENPDLETKQAEAFAFLGDDEKVITAYNQAKVKSTEMNPLLLHLSAVAFHRTGEEKTAWKLWREALQQTPGFDLARESLADRWLPAGERNVPWYWTLNYWFPGDIKESIYRHFGRETGKISDQAMEQYMMSLWADNPYLPQLFPHMLERGDKDTREFVLNITRILAAPEMLQALYDFARGQYGTDQIRLEALQFITKEYPHMLPENKMVPVWLKGKQTEIFLMGFEISYEPQVADLPDEIQDKHDIVFELIQNEEADAAEPLLREIIADAPEFPTAYNHLAAVYEQQGRHDEARALVEETYNRFPDYFFAQVSMASIFIQDGQLEKAKELLDPLMRLEKLHISEFRALARAEMEIALAEENPEAAQVWLDMWRGIEEDNLEIFDWELRIRDPENVIETLRKLVAGRQNRKRKTG